MKVVHCKHVDLNDPNIVLIDRTTIFGNPFRMRVDSEEERERVIEEFRIWFEKKIKNDWQYRLAVLLLDGYDLACWCAPKPCHGDVIMAWLNKYREKK